MLGLIEMETGRGRWLHNQGRRWGCGSRSQEEKARNMRATFKPLPTRNGDVNWGERLLIVDVASSSRTRAFRIRECVRRGAPSVNTATKGTTRFAFHRFACCRKPHSQSSSLIFSRSRFRRIKPGVPHTMSGEGRWPVVGGVRGGGGGGGGPVVRRGGGGGAGS